MFIDIDAKKALKMLTGLGDRLDDTTPLMQDIAGAMMDAVEENFARGGRPPWPDLAPATKAARRRKGKWPGKILQVSQGGLAASVAPRVTKDEAAVGTNKVYAAVHQFGWEERNIPARPYLTLAGDDIQEIDDIIGDYLDI